MDILNLEVNRTHTAKFCEISLWKAPRMLLVTRALYLGSIKLAMKRGIRSRTRKEGPEKDCSL